MRLTVECLGRTHALRFARLDRPVRSLAKAVAKAAGVERVVLEADGGVLDGAAKVGAVLTDGQRLLARVPLDLPWRFIIKPCISTGTSTQPLRSRRRRGTPRCDY
jgi:hypothetical protein